MAGGKMIRPEQSGLFLFINCMRTNTQNMIK
nr:MAG TPA: hypothetical protein [Caudoviricetes sp.]